MANYFHLRLRCDAKLRTKREHGIGTLCTVNVSSEADYVKEKIKAQKAEENIVSDDEGMRLCRGQEETGPESGEMASIKVAVHSLSLELLFSASISWLNK